jgi:hypothetical protein
MQISRLRVGNEDFLVSSMIERCPKSMMLRELVKNAVEAASGAPVGERRVVIGPLMLEGGRKLSIWNSGPGMDAGELFRMCDIASSIGKQNGLDQNFGMGAKVASLPSNPHGIRYRSCKAGRVHQVVMGKREGVYGRLSQATPTGEPADVLDVTEQAAQDGRRLDADWTEVVLLGTRAEQHTVADPYAGSPGMSPGWLAEELYTRFYSLPTGLDLVLGDGCAIAGGDHIFMPLSARVSAFARYEAVPGERGTIFHYFYDAPDADSQGRLMSARGALQPARCSAALIYRDEIYDMRPAWAWQHEAPVFGIPFGARNISVYVQLPDDFPLLPDGYRQFLRHNHNLQQHVTVREFAPQALRNRPGWLLDMMSQFAPDAQHTQHLHGEMSSLFKTLGIHRRWWPPGDGRPHEPRPGDGGIEYEVAPQIMPLRDESDILERGMENKAARFYPETHQLFINTTYAGYVGFRHHLESAFAAAEDQEAVRRAALIVAERLLTRQVCRKLVFGLSKRGSWHGWEVDQATSMYSLTLAADDNGSLFQEASQDMQAQLGVNPVPDAQLESARTRVATALEDLLALRMRQGHQPMELSLRFA